MDKPYSSACDSNRDPILSVIQPLLEKARVVLEIGSGTGQHAVYFAEKMPHLIWHTSDREENHAGINLWLNEAALQNIREPIILNVNQKDWPAIKIDAVFSANSVHIMSWQEVKLLFKGVSGLLPHNGLFVLYGPFNYNYDYTSESNERFDAWLKANDVLSGIRNFEDLDQLAKETGLQFLADYEMPANNYILCWQKQTS